MTIRPLFSLLALVACASAQDWPQFLGPTGDGQSAAKDVPLEWSATKNVVWKTPIPGRGWSSPALVGGKLYLTTAVATRGSEDGAKSDRSLRALCVDAATGKILWDKEVFTQDGAKAPDSIHKKNGHASPSPVVADGKLFVHFGHQGTACLNLDGTIVWTQRGLNYEPQHGNGGSPIVVDDKLVFNCDGRSDPFIVALNTSDGKVAWKVARPTKAPKKFAFATDALITVSGRKMIISPGADLVQALDPKDGSEIWRCVYEGYSIVPKPIYGQGLVFLSSAFDTPDVYAISPDGKGDVTDTHVKWTAGKGAPCTPTMSLVGDELYWVNDSGMASCVEAKTGKSIWQERTGLKGVSASLIHAGGRIYVQGEDGKTVVLQTGGKFKILAENSLGEKTYATPVPLDGGLIIRGEANLYRLGKK